MKYTITTALPYANGPIHIGHLAGNFLPADIFTRYLRSKHHDVILIGGTDEHGIPIMIRAKKEGISPQEIVDKYHESIKKDLEEFGISFDVFSRTSFQIHHQTVIDFFNVLYDKKVFIEKDSLQYYDEKSQQFLADRYIIGECPHCGNKNAYGDQCEQCGNTLTPDDLKNPISTLSNERPIKKSTHHWYFSLDNYQKFLEKWILEDHKDWKINVYGQCKSWLNQGLSPRAITRDLSWGVPVPLKEAKDKVFYVWFEAPIGYISATKQWAQEHNTDWQPYWKDESTKLIQFLGKDNIVFHCIIFPAMLKAHGDFILPTNVVGNEFMNLEGDKISTSRNHAVWLHDYLQQFPGQQDALRYMLCSNMPETKDSDFKWSVFYDKYDNELAAIVGNFVNRTLTLVNKYYDGYIPENDKNYSSNDKEIISFLSNYSKKIEDLILNYHFKEALQEVINVMRNGNKYLSDIEPWHTIKTDSEQTKRCLYLSVQVIAHFAYVAYPFLPFTCEKIKNMLNLSDLNDWNKTYSLEIISSGNRINDIQILFPKLEK